jgi:murein peptide amidase A
MCSIAGMQTFVFGETNTGLPIMGYRFGQTGPNVLVLGGVHGDEIEGVWAANGLLKAFSEKYDLKLKLTLVPMFNLDGILMRERRNASKIDLNRNLPTKDWTSEVATERYFPGHKPNSEKENQALVSFLDREKPKFILSLHSYKPMLNYNGDCKIEAEVISSFTGYIVTESIGYPTPGSLGTYAGLEHGMPTLTYEVERGLDQASVLKQVPAIIAGLRSAERHA